MSQTPAEALDRALTGITIGRGSLTDEQLNNAVNRLARQVSVNQDRPEVVLAPLAVAREHLKAEHEEFLCESESLDAQIKQIDAEKQALAHEKSVMDRERQALDAEEKKLFVERQHLKAEKRIVRARHEALVQGSVQVPREEESTKEQTQQGKSQVSRGPNIQHVMALYNFRHVEAITFFGVSV
ncbi:hypothetical protein SMACR_09670 [Sordaria macrospora]|uniref:WGS project CABT00000000 data, contig 2.144 n=2 Tax=Sordaria macrospora TaxID=5147 RepID=F7WCJ4_SORMK|nr:uncharacterized protein SMAC_09670 [Sordaria macrospora k-hell]KAA8630338.1 hypothetical protein SMACR_09670 [Sordaria macrospora]KAH7625350.1 hypothetical protein B0T09DRAFT_393313 [Sordaria sp. MPI-SDFR-AT-0083]WPJ62663.1 hypothetical protein SMAC4_09670 [Sordaria macrospora]CCC05636.1 unnamed protein product [Sordaria macrospora k-hell]